MKKIVLILICIFTFSLIGCNKKVDNTSAVSHKKTKLNYPIHLSNKVLDNTSDITEDDNFIYYADKNGINKEDKKSGKNKLILKKKDVKNLVLSGEYIFFSVISGENTSIFCVNKIGKNSLRLFNGEDIRNNDQLRNFTVYDNKIFIDIAGWMYLFDMKSNKLNIINYDVEKYKIINGDMFYIDHGQKTFTIYKTDLNDMKTEIFLGKGISRPKDDIYRSFVFVGNSLYFVKSFPDSAYKKYSNGLYFYDNGNEKVVFKNDNEWVEDDISEYMGNVYFIITGSDEKCKLNKYCPKDKTISQVACLDFSEHVEYSMWGEIKIVNGYWYYINEKSKIRCVKLDKM